MSVIPSLSREESWMRKSALHYLGQRSTSVANLRQVLQRRARRRLGPDVDVAEMIERTIDYCRQYGFVDDTSFVEARLHAGRSRGLSARRIGAALAAKGIDRTLMAQVFAGEDRHDAEERAAARLAQRRRIGPWRREERAFEIEKEIAVLARGGFSISLSRRIITGDPDEIRALLEA
ncbi:RecX family transcriptional regulator [Labrys okinawensis]|uniref:Regulatory protein RecX n=1 Tax=Labrys okinawensis TaxID=346911 RepID=A0A2S9Q6D0_9HYPH|nr:RecX family transcriptional regulator [Labrys okinawensis]PRH84909.1 RecX family transcriptional regulator [Labrys okinawensis]